jgi:3D-(3,5/4)-trihydroxycyclohexane-1,2-dione acylhydrolase (decyclizing)
MPARLPLRDGLRLRGGVRRGAQGALAAARAAERTTVVHVETDPMEPNPDAQAGWDVPAAEVSAPEPARDVRATGKVGQRSAHLPLRPRAPR